MTTDSSRDPLIDAAAGRFTGPLVRRIGLPSPRALRREAGPWRADELALRATALGGPEGGFATPAIQAALRGAGVALHDGPVWSVDADAEIAVFDATGCRDLASLDRLRAFFGPLMRQLAPCARLVVVGVDPRTQDDPVQRALAAALDGFVRSLAKEVGRNGATANLLQVRPQALDRLDGPLRFLCSHRAAYVSGRTIAVTDEVPGHDVATEPVSGLKGRLAIVTGAARGLGAATAERLAEEGARVLCVDVPSAAVANDALASRLGGTALPLDITQPDAGERLVAAAREQGPGIDIVVHNAGITRDRTLARMSDREWDATMAVNLRAILDIDAALDQARAWNAGAREVCLSSISGLAGNVGQANYAATKAALVGYVSARASQAPAPGMTINAVAPGFIETEMTRRIPFMIREAGRRMNALSQGGQPRDVAEMVAFLALPQAVGVTGQTIRVCGQALMGA